MMSPPRSPTKSPQPSFSSPPLTPRLKELRNDQSGTNSVRSGSESGSIRQRSSSVRSHRRSSFALHHHDSLSYLSEERESKLKALRKSVKVPWWTSKRVCLSVICFVGFFFLYAQRVNLSVGIVCMVKSAQMKKTHSTSDKNDTEAISYSNFTTNSTGSEMNVFRSTGQANRSVLDIDHSCPTSPFTASEDEGDFDWDKPLQGLILGAFFWGYTIMQIPGGVLAERFGPRKVIATGMITVSLMTVLTPVLARGSPYLLVIGRVIIGMGEATMYPGAQVLWAKWSPPDERSRLVGFAFGGCQLGNALAFPIASLLCAYGFDGGWPSIFYCLGSASLVWCAVWIIFVRDTPREMPGITAVEREHIELSLGFHESKDLQAKQRREPKPWKSILTSMPVWAILVANACGNYGAYMLLTQMPTYMKEVLRFDIKSNGVFSMIPYLVFWVVVIIAGVLADFLISRQILSIEWTRKFCCSIGHFVPAAFLVAVGYMDCWHQTAAVVLLTFSMAFCGFQFASVFINHGDIAPRYAGTIFGITNTGASIPGIVAPYVVAAVTPNKSQEEWLRAFYIAAVIYCVGAIFYDIFAQGEIQPWAQEDELEVKGRLDLHGISEEDHEHDDVFNETKSEESSRLKS